ncbi:MAG: methyltransferase domain-containing protein [Acidobacteriota bacterium]|jgi:ubiquinone/menaquinone biosynthesis C-methylase UbiE
MARLRSRYYDLFSHWYDGFVALHSRDRQGGLRRQLALMAGLQPGDTVLDLCTGTGAQLAELHSRVAPDGHVLGVDFSRGMLRKALAKCESLGGIDLIRADVAYLPFKKKAVDGVTCSHAFYELSGQATGQCLREVVRVLKPGRSFLMMEHDIPTSRFIRLLFYIRICMMGRRRALEILRDEVGFFGGHFDRVEKVSTESGRSKILICRNDES